MTITSIEFRTEVAQTLAAAGKTDKAAIQATMRAMVAKLQEGYKGALAIMVPGDVSARPEQWTRTYIFTVLDVCQRHSRKPEQVRAALAAVL